MYALSVQPYRLAMARTSKLARPWLQCNGSASRASKNVPARRMSMPPTPMTPMTPMLHDFHAAE
jgi:hypothetical protein